jgi:hypothetical protein
VLRSAGGAKATTTNAGTHSPSDPPGTKPQSSRLSSDQSERARRIPPVGSRKSNAARCKRDNDVTMERISLDPVDRVRITVLVDNLTDPLIADQNGVRRINWPKALTGGLPRAGSRVSPDDGVPPRRAPISR